jgi:hypothetical protein
MRVRFGGDLEALKIDACARSSPLLYSLDGQVRSARIGFVFSSPLVVSPGDTINVSVQMKHEEWHTRTYSIAHYNAHQKSAGPPCQVVSSVEVCVRNMGVVSSYLCSQQSSFPARVMVKSAPHFRIEGNSSPEEETFFVAQGGQSVFSLRGLFSKSA